MANQWPITQRKTALLRLLCQISCLPISSVSFHMPAVFSYIHYHCSILASNKFFPSHPLNASASSFSSFPLFQSCACFVLACRLTIFLYQPHTRYARNPVSHQICKMHTEKITSGWQISQNLLYGFDMINLKHKPWFIFWLDPMAN